ncbi:MAG: heme-copper oxidase subunit III [SAR324 cluster bacterium]|nr:heme-copper oxidase subunit III [SAR324 cluster bacterium]
MILLVAPEIPANSNAERRQLVSSSIFATVIMIMTEVMFFAALISAYMIIRSGAEEWPPWGQPRLPVFATAINSLTLLASAFCLHRSVKVFSSQASQSKQLLALAIALGIVFVSVQGYEWVQLISFGLTITSSTYGGVFYLIIGAHGLHVIGGLLALLACLRRLNSTSQQLTIDNLRAAQIFWYFVVGVWPILYTLVYLL